MKKSPNLGGKRPGAGRKSDRRNRLIAELLDEIVSEKDWIALVKSAYSRALGGDQRALDWLSDRRYGKAPQSVDLTSGGKEMKSLTQIIFKEVDGSKKED